MLETEKKLQELEKWAVMYGTREGVVRDHIEDLRWYICSGRAPLEWEKAFNKAKKKTLCWRFAKAGITSTNLTVDMTTSYLRRYCGLAV